MRSLIPCAFRHGALVLSLLGMLLWTPHAQAENEPRWGVLTVVADAPYDTLGWREAVDLEGRLVAEAPLEPALNRGLRVLAAAGYPFAEASPGSFDVVDGRVVGIIKLTPGVQARLTGLVLDGAKVTRPGTAYRVSGVTPGQVYTGGEDRRIRERLARSGLFSGVGDPELVPGLEADAVLLKIPVTEPAYTRFGGLLGVSGAESEISGFLDLELRNIAGTAREGAAFWENRGDGLTRFRLSYREPWLPYVPVGVFGSLRHDVNEGLYSYTKWEILGSAQLGDAWRFQFGRGGTRAVTVLPELDELDEGGDQSKSTESYFVAGVQYDRRDSAINPQRGFLLRFDSNRGTKTIEVAADTSTVRLDRTAWRAAGEAYLPVARRWLLVTASVFDFLDTPEIVLPQWDLYGVGGARSVRGYREEQWFTRGVILSRNELRWVQDTRGSAVYLLGDVGFIQEEGRQFSDLFDRFLYGAGVGVRQANRLGILGVEYAVPRGASILDGRIHLRIDAVF